MHAHTHTHTHTHFRSLITEPCLMSQEGQVEYCWIVRTKNPFPPPRLSLLSPNIAFLPLPCHRHAFWILSTVDNTVWSVKEKGLKALCVIACKARVNDLCSCARVVFLLWSQTARALPLHRRVPCLPPRPPPLFLNLIWKQVRGTQSSLCKNQCLRQWNVSH